ARVVDSDVSLAPPAARPRPRRVWWPIVATAAAAAVLIAVLSLAVALRHEAEQRPQSSVPPVGPAAPRPADPTPLVEPGLPAIAPGTYSFDADGDAATSLGANVTLEGSGGVGAAGDFSIEGLRHALAAGFYKEPARESGDDWVGDAVSLMIVQVE